MLICMYILSNVNIAKQVHNKYEIINVNYRFQMWEINMYIDSIGSGRPANLSVKRNQLTSHIYNRRKNGRKNTSVESNENSCCV